MAKLEGKSTGIVVTCEFPNATRADFACHYPERNNYEILSKQFVYNSPDIFFGGGEGLLDKYKLKSILQDSLNFKIINELSEFRQNTNDSVWALFSNWQGNKISMSYNCDRDSSKEPSLAEMTQKAIEILSKNEKGFFLMIEGSEVDWAAHNNDPYAAITELIAVDAAIKTALDFAKRDRHTLIVVCPDHGNGGFSIGNKVSGKYDNNFKYDKISINNQLIKPLKSIKMSADKLAAILIKYPDSLNTSFIYNNYNVIMKDKQIKSIKKILNSKKYSNSQKQDTINYIISSEYSNQNFIGWTTTGHTGEDVFLGVYNPANFLPASVYGKSIIDNTEVPKYISNILDYDLKSTTNKYFIKISNKSVFKHFEPEKNIKGINSKQLSFYNKNTGTKIIIPANTNFYYINGKKIFLKSLIINIYDNYYIPAELYNIINMRP